MVVLFPNRFGSLILLGILMMLYTSKAVMGQTVSQAQQPGPASYWLIAKDSCQQQNLMEMQVIRAWDSKHWVVRNHGVDLSASMPTAHRLTNNRWKCLQPGILPTHAEITVVQVSNSVFFLEWLRSNLPDRHFILGDNGRYALYDLSKTAIEQLLNCPWVQVLDYHTAIPTLENSLEEFDLNVNRVNILKALDRNLQGSGMVLAVKETRMDTTDIDLSGRYLKSGYESDFVANHTTIMTTIAAGAGNSQPASTGVAPDAHYSSFDFTNPLPDLTANLMQLSVSAENHSYGFGIDNRYGMEAQAYDQQIFEWPQLVHVASVGNEGLSSSSTGSYAGIQGFATVSSGFKMAKNVITVGAVDSFGIPLPRNSRGPAYDGRIKPEVMAFGNDGSSGAAALTSGVVLLLQEWYLKHFGQLPDNALVRAILLQSAQDIGSPGPDYTTGYGVLHAGDALQILLDEDYVEGVLEPGEIKTINVTVDTGARQLKVTLAWVDTPGILLSDTALVSDLDLEVIAPDGTIFLPWVLSSYPSIDSLELPARRGRDHLNPQEQISIDIPQPGSYQIRISTANPTGEKPFALAWSKKTPPGFEWTYPYAEAGIPAGQPVLLRWDTWQVGTGKLSYRLSGDSLWQDIAVDVDLSQNGYRWPTPEATGWIAWRMILGTDSFSTAWMHLYQPLDIKTGFLCADTVLLHWSPDPTAMDYTLYRWSGSLLEPILRTPDTSVVVPVTDGRFAVQANFADAPGVRSPTRNSYSQGVGCYLNNFLANLSDGTVRLQAILGSLFEVRTLEFQKWDGQQFVTLATVDPILLLDNIADDSDLQQGENTYRVVITLVGGATITSTELTIYYLPPSAFFIYPNPVSVDGYLYIDRGDDSVLECQIYDMQGRVVYRDILYDQYDSIWMGRFAAGVYYYQLLDEEGRVQEGKLVVY